MTTIDIAPQSESSSPYLFQARSRAYVTTLSNYLLYIQMHLATYQYEAER
jgi:hypothetical protein